MKLTLKIIAIIVLLSLISATAYQIYWLRNFYNEQYSKLETSVINAMNIADLNELGMRVTSIQLGALEKIEGLRKTEKDGKTIYSIKKNNSGMEIKLDSILGKYVIETDSIIIVNPPDVVVRIPNEGEQANMWNDVNIMTSSIQHGFHRVVDSLQAVNLIRYDSLLQVEFDRLNIHIPYALKYVNCTSDSIIESIIPENFDLAKSKMYPFSISEKGQFEYQLYLDNPQWNIFKSMSGLVIISILMILILIVSYVVLLKFIYRQKSIDEIKSDFTNNMTHELKTPISVAFAAIDALQNFGMGDDTETRGEYLSISKDQLINLNNLVEQILTMSVEERENLKIMPVEISLEELFTSVKNKFLLNATKNIEIEISTVPEDLIVLADKVHFSNIISNLVENAIKYSGKNVIIKLIAYKKGDKTIVKIEDNGMGIPSSALSKIFDKYYRVPSGNVHNVKGYGLGLAYVKTIIEKHKWEISVSSTEGKGTTFKIIMQ